MCFLNALTVIGIPMLILKQWIAVTGWGKPDLLLCIVS